MKSLRNMLSVIVAVGALLISAPLGAQSYEGTNLEDGIFFVPAAVGPGSDIDFDVTGLEPNSELAFVLTDAEGNDVDGLDVQVLGTVVVRADAQGNFNGEITLPLGLAAGVYTVDVNGTRADGSPFVNELTFVVSDAAAAQTGGEDTGDGELAFTGVSSGRTAFNGILIVGVGVVLVLAASRRRQDSPVSAEV